MQLHDHQVLQRTSPEGVVVATDSGPVELPVGGPYEVVDRHGRTLARDVLVGDLWLMAGQSNMEGHGDWTELETPHAQVHLLAMDRTWGLAQEPLHRRWSSPDPVHWDGMDDETRQRELIAFETPPREYGTGLGLSFAKELLARTGVPIGLIASAHGGTTMARWDPELRGLGAHSLYGSMLNQVAFAGGQIAGVLWCQGESDGCAEGGSEYAERLAAFHAALMADLGDLQRLQVQAGRMSGDPQQLAGLLPLWTDEDWSTVREAQRTGPATAVVSAVDLDLYDFIHLSCRALKRLGRRLALVAAGEPPITIERIDRVEHTAVVRVGGTTTLPVGAQPTGFRWHRRDGMVEASAQVVDGRTVVVSGDRAGSPLSYGWGLNSRAELRDERDLAVPAFGPLRTDT